MHPPGLVLDPVKASDRDLYRCRVDYDSSPTRNVRIQLNVVVPPRRVHIVNEKGMDVNGVIGPYHVGVTVKLQCRAEGGDSHKNTKPEFSPGEIPYYIILDIWRFSFHKINMNGDPDCAVNMILDETDPKQQLCKKIVNTAMKTILEIQSNLYSPPPPTGEPRPSVTWWSGGTLLDDVSEDRRGDITINTLTLHSIARHDLYRALTCQVINSNLSDPMTATVTLDMSFPPLTVKIMSLKDELSEDEKYKIVCESSGSRPSASITWWKNGMLMTDARKQVFQEGNITRSTLHLIPSPADNDVYISCRAENPRVPTAVIEDSAKLNVHYTPRLSLAAGQNLDMEDIKEGDDVYFECGIQANPRVYKVQWFHNGEELSHNVSAGVIQSNQSLVLQRVTRASSGDYKCTAANLHGSSESNSVQLSVKFAPLCAEGQKVVYGAGKQEELNVTCSVEAHPQPFAFRWAFNSSSEVVDIPPSRTRLVGEGVSQVSYTPTSHLDYGSLLCWATNDVSRQHTPCIYHIIHASECPYLVF
ncbi:peroxidasin homolog [Penaeus monodon]|uniref:peroxidasin homolog n=1 Tax=Penaeus monodon TaxID=6687 RepID=UPI0018A7463E|nr:peroxidasin homolog [Penaeus monodon]